MPSQVKLVSCGRGIVGGTARGPAAISRSTISFLGDVDIRSGNIVGRSNDLYGCCIAGCVLVIPGTRGSAGAWRFLYQLKMHGTHPVAIVTDSLPDPSVVQGAILANIPVVAHAAAEVSSTLLPGRMLEVDGDTGQIQTT